MGKFYRHFKGKPYRFLGTAKFSENLEEMVVYETMYDNPEGKLWVRPRAMFEEMIERDGELKPRFRPIGFELAAFTDSDNQQILSDITELAAKVLDRVTPDLIATRLAGKSSVLIQTCRLDGQLVGFKIGYGDSKHRFYSWLGAVDPAFHRLGVASALMSAQHDWCRDQGFREIETRTTNDHPAMLILNVKSGFAVSGTCVDGNGRLKIIMVRKLG